MNTKPITAGSWLGPGLGLLLAFALLSACVPERPAPISQGAENSIPASGQATTPGADDAGTASISVADQELSGGGVVVPRVVSAGPGWVAIHSQQDGTVGPVIGYAYLDSGVNLNVLVPVDSSAVTPVLYATLYIDAGELGAFENPSPDAPVIVGGEIISLSFSTGPGTALSPTAATAAVTASVTITSTPATASPAAATQTTTTGTPPSEAGSATPQQSTTPLSPEVVVSNQILDSWEVTIDQVTSIGPGWIVVYAVADGKSDEEIGRAPVKEGLNRNLRVPVDGKKTTGMLFALLHEDSGIIGTYENPGADVAVVVGTRIVGTQFNIRLKANAPTETPEPGKPKPKETKETTPAVIETTPVVVETTPVVVETTPVVVETTPVIVETTPVIVETTPVVVETTPDVPPPPDGITEEPPPATP